MNECLSSQKIVAEPRTRSSPALNRIGAAVQSQPALQGPSSFALAAPEPRNASLGETKSLRCYEAYAGERNPSQTFGLPFSARSPEMAK
ncbi:hypothetical protein ACJ73_01333 [Blastomyces percursus]|uniref:Uncharacterized protein n=1 Tax=Blastomyces percursus TaxID=1658174 RepID=A0A1J9R4I4_9EURO|nr:hypothetical protein ACJ73_01333 [Blastomyces percursus]